MAQQLQMQLLQQCVVSWPTRLAIRTLFLALLTAASTALVGALDAPGHHHDQDEMQQGGLPQQQLFPQAGQARSQTVVLPLSRGPLRVVPGRASQQFWSEVEIGRWEPETFKVLYQELTSNVSYLGVGEWCGITGLFAAQRSSRAILVEPDPVALHEWHCACPCSLHRQRRAPILGSSCSPVFSGAFCSTGSARA